MRAIVAVEAPLAKEKSGFELWNPGDAPLPGLLLSRAFESKKVVSGQGAEWL